MPLTFEQKQFIKKVGSAAVCAYDSTKLLPSLTIAQAILESGWGKSALSKECFNFFGIKYNDGLKTLGICNQYKIYKTKEQKTSGTVYYENARFCKWNSFEEGIAGRNKFLVSKARYSNLIGVKDYKTACKTIKQDGYATDIKYPERLISIIEKYNLVRFDEQAFNGAHEKETHDMDTLKIGSKGSQVRALQMLLRDSFAYGLTVDGDFGERTERAVKLLQKDYKLTVDGVVGEKTWAVILK